MHTYKVRKPMYNYSQKNGNHDNKMKTCVGVPVCACKGSLLIEITATRKDGTRPYPHLYSITEEKVLTYDKGIFSSTGEECRYVPIEDLTIVE